jgi:hypothetical protein
MNGRALALRVLGLVVAAALFAAVIAVVPPAGRMPFALLALPIEMALLTAVVPTPARSKIRSH